MATRPATSARGDAERRWPCRCCSALDERPGQRAGAAAMCVLTNAQRGEAVRRASALPALKPNQPNHSRPAPSTRHRQVVRRRRAVRVADALAEHEREHERRRRPTVMCTTVPPAKSSAPQLEQPAAGGPHPVRDRVVDERRPAAAMNTHVGARTSCARRTRREISAGVMIANIIWKTMNRRCGMVLPGPRAAPGRRPCRNANVEAADEAAPASCRTTACSR